MRQHGTRIRGGNIKPLTLNCKREEMCSENVPHQRTDLGSSLRRDFPVAEHRAVSLGRTAFRVRRRERVSGRESRDHVLRPRCEY